VGLSNFAGSIGIGLSGVDTRTRLRVGIAFGLFEGMMPIVGLLIGAAVAGRIGSYGRYAGSGLLVLTGLYTIWQGIRTGKLEEDAEKGILDTRELLLLGAALSIDNLIVGFALGVYHVPIVLAAVMMAVVSVGLSLLGLELGSRLGARVGEYSEMAGGGVLVLVGIALGAGLV
jgi:putative Mn2+ efflux pump MntP